MNGKSPDAFRTISEVADWLGVNAHVLRFWESKFSQIKPVKRAGGRRYYRRSDMELLGGIQKLLHEDGMTIKGVQKILRDQGIRAVAALSKPIDVEMPDELAVETTAETPAAAPEQDETTEVAAPAPDIESEEFFVEVIETNEPAEVLPLFDRMPFPGGAPTAEEPPTEAREEPSPLSPAPPPEPDAPDDAGPVIAPLPGAELTLTDALGRLVPMQIPPELLAPIHARMVALRDRMDAGA